MGTYEINKLSLLCFDDKRFVLNNGIHTLAHFHKSIFKNRFSQISQIKRIQKDSYKWLQIKTNAYKSRLADRRVDRGTCQ